MKTSCNIVGDLMQMYVEGQCSHEEKQLVDEHIAECAGCKARLESMQRAEPQIDSVPRPDRIKRYIRIAIGVVVAVVILALACLWDRSIFNIVDTAWSAKGTRAMVVYNRAPSSRDSNGPHMTFKMHDKLSGIHSEAFALHWLRASQYNIVLCGEYDNGAWSPDGSKFVANIKREYNMVHIIDFANTHSPNIDILIGTRIKEGINNDPEQFGYSVPFDAEVNNEFLQWGEDSDTMLIHYAIWHDGEELGSGYCWYAYGENTVSSFCDQHFTPAQH